VLFELGDANLIVVHRVAPRGFVYEPREGDMIERTQTVTRILADMVIA
jgi:hypothetical protein